MKSTWSTFQMSGRNKFGSKSQCQHQIQYTLNCSLAITQRNASVWPSSLIDMDESIYHKVNALRSLVCQWCGWRTHTIHLPLAERKGCKILNVMRFPQTFSSTASFQHQISLLYMILHESHLTTKHMVSFVTIELIIERLRHTLSLLDSSKLDIVFSLTKFINYSHQISKKLVK